MTLGERDAARTTSSPVRRLLQRWEPGEWTRDASGITIITALLVVIGLVMSFSASFVDGAQAGDTFGVFRRQVMWAGVGVVGFGSPRAWTIASGAAWPGPLLALGAGRPDPRAGPGRRASPRYGSTRWLGFGPMVVQPSEIAKLALLLWLADVLHRKRPADGSVHASSTCWCRRCRCWVCSPDWSCCSRTSAPRSCWG
jgi:cell division protein FtsW